MQTIKLTVEPNASPQRVFNASQFAEAIHGKKPAVAWNDDKVKLVEALWDAVAAKVAGSVKINNVQTSGMKARLEAAKIKKREVPGVIAPGKAILEVRVLERDSAEEDEDGPDKVPVAVEIDEPPEQPEAADFATLVKDGDITFSNSKVKAMVTGDRNNSDKAASIFERGKGYKGHGPTESISGLHAHVTNRTALGFKWSGDKLQILGIGEKNDSAGKGTSGYDWTT